MNTILKSKITDKCAWVGSEIKDQTDWIYQLSPHILNVLDQALKILEAKQLKAPEFNKYDALIEDPIFLTEIEKISNELENGYGFIVIRGLDANKYDEFQLANLYYLIGLHWVNLLRKMHVVIYSVMLKMWVIKTIK